MARSYSTILHLLVVLVGLLMLKELLFGIPKQGRLPTSPLISPSRLISTLQIMAMGSLFFLALQASLSLQIQIVVSWAFSMKPTVILLGSRLCMSSSIRFITLNGILMVSSLMSGSITTRLLPLISLPGMQPFTAKIHVMHSLV